MSSFDIDVRGLPETQEMLAQVTGRQLQNRTKRAVRAGAKVMREGLRSEVRARSDLPKSFAKTKTSSHRNPIGVSVAPTSLLARIFEHGARSHSIGRAGQLLAHVEGRYLTFLARGPVRHPGMAARPFVVPVFEDKKRPAGDAIERTLFEGIE